MPVITVYYDDLEELSGIDKDTVIQRIPMMGCDIERIEDDHIDIEFGLARSKANGQFYLNRDAKSSLN